MAGQVGTGITAIGQVANLNAGAAITLYTPITSGQYRISATQEVTLADGASSTMPSLTIGWTNPDSNQAETNALLATAAGNALTTMVQGSVIIKAKAGVAITATSASYASGTPATMQFNSTVRIEAM